MPEKSVYHLNDGEDWWICAYNEKHALAILACDLAGYKDIESFQEDMGDVKVEKLQEGDLLEVVDFDNPSKPPEKKTAKEWAQTGPGLIASSNV